ncbi:MAG: hypothetical protein Q7S57_02160 [bacterium]|nr:hypothetical protein [bacterium]
MENQAIIWAKENFVNEPPPQYYCPTRDIADGRLPKLYQEAIANGLAEEKTALLTALAAELTTNCFDHNLGSWKDISGCWFSFEVQNNVLRIIIADRGQGVLRSLQQADKNLTSHHDALIVALTKQISGRQPENRGRGLKFIMKSLNQEFPEAHFFIQTGDAKFETVFPINESVVASFVQDKQEFVYGTYAEVEIIMNTR